MRKKLEEPLVSTKDTDNKSIESSVTPLMSPDANEVSTLHTCMDTKYEGTYENVHICEDDDTLVIEPRGDLDKNRIQDHEPEGDRIINVSFFMKEMHRTFDNHARGIECQFQDWHLVNSHRCGFKTRFFFKCRMCHYKADFWSHPTDDKTLDINTAMTAGTVTIGIGYAQLEEQMAAANIPCMSEKTYIKHRELVLDEFEKTALENMKKAGEIEKQLALESDEVINGIPYITVVVDGCWAKRSYKTNYDSLSGVAAIIGYRTRKVLFVGIRNKFCTVCNMAERNGYEARVHKCYKNFDRNESSTRMESDAIVEGFKCSIEMHGLIFKTVIADGDSSVYQSIINNKVYIEHNVIVKKIECTNHLLRNFCKKLKTLSETTQPNMRRNRKFIQCRNLVKYKIKKMRNEVTEAAAQRMQEKQPDSYKIKQLQKDILNIPSHIFGEHKECKERGRTCKNSNNAKETNHVPLLSQYNIYQKVLHFIITLSAYSESLLLNVTSNSVESFNSVICKAIGGKRINFGTRGSYNARVAGAVIHYNTQQVLTEVHANICKNIPPVVENLEKRRQIKVARTRESRKVVTKPKKVIPKAGTDCHYGPQSQKPDLPSDIFEQLKQNHLHKLSENGKNWKQIERETIGQNESELWHSLRKEMLTASNFGVVCRMRPTTSCATYVKNILFPPYIDNAAMKYGRDMEERAKQQLREQLKKDIEPCGLFIDSNNPFLGASPDGLLDEDGLVEIKCPHSAENLTAEEACKLPVWKGIFNKKFPNIMNRNHRFFYQIQGQLNITQRDYCIFAVWTSKDMKTVRVNRDNDFWTNKMLPFLTRFYLECMLPEILDSRHNRHMPIRNPRYIAEAMEEAEKKQNSRKRIRQDAEENENVIEQKIFTFDILSTEASTDAVVAQNEENDDCVFVSYTNDITEDEKAKLRKTLDDVIPSLSLVEKNVLPVHSLLNDESLDRFLRVVRETSSFETQSVQYIEFPDIIVPSHSDKSIQIIGGNCSNHWRCIFFDGTKVHIYDSLPGCTYDNLKPKERNYIHLRYPTISRENVISEKVQKQPDGCSCGIYAAAFATTIALGGNPCEEKYSKDVVCMRQHFIKIVQSNKLLHFPRN